MNYPDYPTVEARVDSKKYNARLLGENELGSVYLHEPLGNLNSNIKIAYLIGMHPLESKSHRALFDRLIDSENLQFCYYVYNIEVKKYNSESEGRLEGQLLAREFVRPHIINEKYDLFIDIHSNRGLNGPGGYEVTNFVFAPGFDDNSMEFVNHIVDSVEELNYYVPEHRTSPPFITEPVASRGIAAVVYECYSCETMEVSYDLASKLISCVDNLNFEK